MKILILTDIEGVNGVLHYPEWVLPGQPYFPTACQLLTEETNQVAAGFLDADPMAEILVLPGHGGGNAIDVLNLDKRVSIISGMASWPEWEGSLDALALVGQHAKAGTDHGHLAHTQTEDALDFRLNGQSIGEYGQIVYALAEQGAMPIFASGDKALAEEVRQLTPQVITVAVKEGLNGPVAANVATDQVLVANSCAIHYPRQQVLANLRAQAKQALQSFEAHPQAFRVKLPAGPYTAEAEYRAPMARMREIVGDLPMRRMKTFPAPTIVETLRQFYREVEWSVPDNVRSFPM